MNIDEKYNARIASMREFTYDWLVENYDDPSKPILKITKSSLGSYDWCPNMISVISKGYLKTKQKP